MFIGEYNGFAQEFQKFSKKFFKDKQEIVKKYPALISRFYNELEDFSSGGKAMRPFLVYLGYKVGEGGDLKKILPVCLAIELVHTFLLIHDDIIDESNLRRNRPTVHKMFEKKSGAHFGRSMAIILGDLAAFESQRLIIGSGFNDKQKQRTLEILNNAAVTTIYGQLLDIAASHNKSANNMIWKIMDLKTANYSIVSPLLMGAILGGGSKEQMEAISKFGLYCGEAFQIQDDILGVFGEEKTIGKSNLSDMREGKNTLLIFEAKNLAKGKDKKELEKLWGKKNATEADLKIVRKIIINSGAFDKCNAEELKLIELSKRYIGKITNDISLQNLFLEMGNFIIGRES